MATNSGGTGTGGAGMFAGISDALSGIGKMMEKNPENASMILGKFGQAISPQNSWQSKLGGVSAGMAQQEAQRQFLQQLFGEGDEEAISANANAGESALKTPASFYGVKNPLGGSTNV